MHGNEPSDKIHTKEFEVMKKFLKAFLDGLMYVLGLDCDMRRKDVDDGLCDFSGQGRNKYGK